MLQRIMGAKVNASISLRRFSVRLSLYKPLVQLRVSFTSRKAITPLPSLSLVRLEIMIQALRKLKLLHIFRVVNSNVSFT